MLRAFLSCVLLLASVGLADAQPIVAGGPVSPDGKIEVQVDFPTLQKTKNISGSDGAGLCVASSIGHSARWQNELLLVNFQQLVKGEPGGSYPEKVDRQIAKFAKGAQYLQYIGNDLGVLRAVLKSGRLPAVTYAGRDGVFYRTSIAHMVNLVHLDEQWACVLDNNFIEDKQLLWMTPKQFQDRWCSPRQGWAVFLLSPPPAPIPTLEGARPRTHGPKTPAAEAAGMQRIPLYEWRTRDDDPNRRYLYNGHGLVGAWDLGERYWRSRLADRWGDVMRTPPVELPEGCNRFVVNYGVEMQQLPEAEVYLLNGEACSRTVAMATLIVDKDLPDDGRKLRLSVIGRDDFRQRVLEDLRTAAVLAPWKERLVVQAYPSGHWQVQGLGFPETGIVLQEPPNERGRGRVLHQQLIYENAEQLARALRRADPNYMPERAPDLSKTAPLGMSFLTTEFLVILGAAGGLSLLHRRNPHGTA